MVSLHSKENGWKQDILVSEKIKGGIIGISISGIVVFLFYHSWIAFAILLIPFQWCFYKVWLKEMCQKKEWEFQKGFLTAMGILCEGLQVGYGIETAIQDTYLHLQKRVTKNQRICKEFKLMVNGLALNKSVQEVFEEMADRTYQEDVQMVSKVLTIGKKTGGNTVALLQKAMEQLKERMDAANEIQVITAQKRLEFKVMSGMPLGILWYLQVTFPENQKVMYKNSLGVMFMSVCLIIYIVALLVGKKVIAIEV